MIESRKFKNPKLKRLANTYINVQLNERKAIESRDTVESAFMYEWNDYQDRRFELLLDINSIVAIPVQDKIRLDGILKDGKAVKEFNRVYGILVDTLAPKNFVVETGAGVSGNERRYIGNFENTTGHDITHIYIGIDYYDKDDNRYVGPLIEPEDTWKNGTKKSFEFSIPDSDTKFKYFKVFISKRRLSFK